MVRAWLRHHSGRLLIGVLAALAPHAVVAGTLDSDAEAFGSIPVLWRPALSPDGSKLAFLQMHSSDVPIASVIDLATGELSTLMASDEDRFRVSWCNWANDERLLCGFTGIVRNRVSGYYSVTRLVAANADGSKMRVLLQGELEDEWTQFQDRIVDWLPDDPEHVLVQVPSSNGSGVSRLDVYNGGTKTVTRPMDDIRAWLSDGHGTPRMRLRWTKRELEWMHRSPDVNKWRTLRKSTPEDDDDFFPLGFGADRNSLLLLQPHENRLALWSMDLGAESQPQLVFAHSEVDVDGFESLGKYRRVVAASYSTDRPHLHFFDPHVEAIRSRLEAMFPGKVVGVIEESWDQRFYLVFVGSDIDPGAYYRFDTKQSVLQRISGLYPKLADRTPAKMKSTSYEAGDGTRIPAYLTLPVGTAGGPLPAVILPHGGPESRDYWGFDWLAQYLAARGYVVLQSNYRGSGGYGGEWSGEGGFRAWRIAIQDVTDGAQHLVDEGIADPDRMCIVGWSYGGYAALMSSVEEPHRYRCAVSIAGVTDPEDLIEENRNNLSYNWVREFVSTDPEVLKQGSPLDRVKEIRIPILLFHGDEDVNVDVRHSRRLAKQLKKTKRLEAYVEYDEVAHGLFRNEYRIDMLRRIGAFLDENTRPRTSAKGAD